MYKGRTIHANGEKSGSSHIIPKSGSVSWVDLCRGCPDNCEQEKEKVLGNIWGCESAEGVEIRTKQERPASSYAWNRKSGGAGGGHLFIVCP